MPHRKDGGGLPAAYRGKEAGFIKHELLRAYLERLFLIVGMAAPSLGVTELCYVDCFAGPWRDESDDLSTSSPAISLAILDVCRRELESRGRAVRIRALYVEKDRKAFARLKQYLSDHAPTGLTVEALEGDFVALIPRVLNWCGEGSFVFFFVDPTQWTPAGVKVLAPLLARPRSEFLINFMYDHLNRFLSKEELKQQMIAVLGEAPDIEGAHGWERDKRVLATYRKNLKRQMPASDRFPARSAYVRVLYSVKDRTKYHLVYLTTHHHGITVFMEISDKLEVVQRLVRAESKQRARIEKTGQAEMFGVTTEDAAVSDSVDIGAVERDWLARLSPEPKRFDEAAFATLLEETDWLPGDLQRALGNLIEEGKVINLDAGTKRRTKHLHYEGKGERLQLQREDR